MHKKVTRSRLAPVAVVALIGCAPYALARRPPLVLATADDVEDSFHGAWLKLIYAEACSRIGFEMALQHYPARRATAMSDAGMVDGEINRVDNYGIGHPEMIRIEPAHFSLNFCAYGHASLRIGPGWRGLADYRQLRIEYRNGVVRCREMLGAHLPASQVSSVDNATLGIRKLAQGRTDLYVDIDSVVERVLLNPEFAQVAIRRLSIVETVKMHCYLHRTRTQLVKPLSEALAAMVQDGSVERFRRAAFAELGRARPPA